MYCKQDEHFEMYFTYELVHLLTWKWAFMYQILNSITNLPKDVWLNMVFVLAATHYFKHTSRGETKIRESCLCSLGVYATNT